MFALFFCWFILASVSFIFGSLMTVLFRADRLFDDSEEYIAFCIWVGLGIAASLCQLAAIAGPVTPWTGVIVSTIAFLLWVPKRRTAVTRLSFSRVEVISLLSLIVAFCWYASTVHVDAYDTALYHQQAVKWLSTFGIVKGVAWFNFRLGWSSSWFALSAIFNHGWLEGRVSAVTGGFVSLVSLLHLAIILARMVRGQSSAVNMILIVIYSLSYAAAWAWHYDVALGADQLTWIYTGLIIWIAVRIWEKQGDRNTILLPLFLASAGSAFKMSLLPLLPATCIFAAMGIRRIRQFPALKQVLVCGVPLCAVLASNILATGCPFYPSPAACIQSDWAVSRTFAAQVQSDTTSFARWGGAAPAGPASSWLLTWLHQKDRLALLLLVVGGALWVTHKTRPGIRILSSWILLCGFSGLAFLFWGAPNPRFGLGFFLVFLAAAFYVTADSKQWKGFSGPRWLSPLIVLCIACAVVIGSLKRQAPFGQSQAAMFLMPARMPKQVGDPIHLLNRKHDTWKTLQTETKHLANFLYITSLSSDQCWDLPVNCTSKLIEADFRLRDPQAGFGAGFVRNAKKSEQHID